MSPAPQNIGFTRSAGMLSIAILHKDLVSAMPDVGFGNMTIEDAVALTSGAAWDTDFYFTPFTGNYQEQEKPMNGTNIWEVSVECFYPGHDSESLFYLTEMERKRFIIDCVDTDGNRRLVGTKKQPLTLIRKYQTGKKAGDQKGHILVFSAQLSHCPPHYAPP